MNTKVLIRAKALVAAQARLFNLGLRSSDVSLEDLSEILDVVEKDAEKSRIDYDAYMARLIQVHNNQVVLNF